MTDTAEGSSEIVVSVPAAAIRAALRFTRRGSGNVLSCVRFHSDGDALLVEATDAYHLIQLRVDHSRDKDGHEVDMLVDFGSRPRIGGRNRDVYLHIAGDHGYLSGQTSKYSDVTRTYFRVRDEKFPDFGELLPADDSAYDGAVGISFNAELITDIYKAALDLETTRVTAIGMPRSDKDAKSGPMVFEATGSGISMRALLMPLSRGIMNRACVREDDHVDD